MVHKKENSSGNISLGAGRTTTPERRATLERTDAPKLVWLLCALRSNGQKLQPFLRWD